MIFSIKLKYFRLVLMVIVKTRQKLRLSISEVLRNCVILLVNNSVVIRTLENNIFLS